MHHLFSAAGDVALAAVLQRRPVLGFDFDGTLAPIVARPDEARVPPALAEQLKALAALRPVVVISGRAAADLRHRLGFEPWHVVGSHGADDPLAPAEAAAFAAALEPLRERLHRHTDVLAAHGVTVEDKQQSIALHYRRARAPARALALLRRLLEPAPPGVQTFGGKRVLNAVAIGAPDKARAMHELVQRCGADCALFAGDDVNDEPVFAAAPADWLTVRVGDGSQGARPGAARFFVDGPEQMGGLIERALELLRLAAAQR